MRPDFHDKPFDEGTVAKLELFQLYAREWLPVFLSPPNPLWPDVHIFDFFAGPGQDINGTPGSPVRVVGEALECKHRLADGKLRLHFHFSDADAEKAQALEAYLRPLVDQLPNTTLEVRPLPFEEAFRQALPILRRQNTANLALIDPCGVNHVDDEVFKQLIGAPTTDFLLFVASSYLHRFSEHPAMKLRIKKSDSFYHSRENGFCIVTQDSDFAERSRLYGAPPKVVWLRCGNSTPLQVEAILRRNAVLITELIQNSDMPSVISKRTGKSTSASTLKGRKSVARKESFSAEDSERILKEAGARPMTEEESRDFQKFWKDPYP